MLDNLGSSYADAFCIDLVPIPVKISSNLAARMEPTLKEDARKLKEADDMYGDSQEVWQNLFLCWLAAYGGFARIFYILN